MTITQAEGSSETLTRLRRRNLETLKRWRSAAKDDESTLEAVQQFTQEVVRAGANLVLDSERNDAQEMLDYWGAQLLATRATTTSSISKTIDPYGEQTISVDMKEQSEATKGERLRAAREQVRLAALARQWQKSKRSSGYLLTGAALRSAEAYRGSKDPDLAAFVEASLTRSRRYKLLLTSVAGTALVTCVLTVLAVISLVNPILHQFERVADGKILAVANPRSATADNNDRLKWLSTYRRLLSPQDLSGITFYKEAVKGVRLVAANFTTSTFTSVQFPGGDFSRAAFIETNFLGKDNNFSNANLRLAQFQGSTICNTSFAGADLYRASFNNAHLFNVDLSTALLRKTYVLGTTFDKGSVERLSDTAWWLATGWDWENLKRLGDLKFDQDKLRKSRAFCIDLAEAKRKLSASEPGNFDQARALNGFAWILATWGLYLAPSNDRGEVKAGEYCPNAAPDSETPGTALEAVQKAIAIANKLGAPPGKEEQKKFNDELANFKGTQAYILMQLDPKSHPEAHKQAFDILRQMSADQKDGSTNFLYAVAQFEQGGDAARKEASETLTTAVAKQRYFPSHEFHLLKPLITGDLKTTLEGLIRERRPTKDEPVSCAQIP